MLLEGDTAGEERRTGQDKEERREEDKEERRGQDKEERRAEDNTVSMVSAAAVLGGSVLAFFKPAGGFVFFL